MTKVLRRSRLALLLIGALGLSAPAVRAQSPDAFYATTIIRILIGHPPGGSYDLYARLTSNHMGRHIPGEPKFIVESRPGGGGIRAVQFFYAQAPRDGSMMGLFFHGIPNLQVVEPDLGKWKMQEMQFVGSFAPVNNVFIINKQAKARTPQAMKTVETLVGCTGKASDSYQGPALLKNLAGFNFRLICGYPGSQEALLALLRGEIEMLSVNWATLRSGQATQLAEGVFTPMFQFGLARMKDIPDVPLLQDLVDDKNAKEIIEFASGGSAIGRALILPPNVPEDRVQTLRSAFDKMVRDPLFLKDAAQAKLDVEPLSGSEAQRIALQIVNSPRAVIERSIEAMK